VAGAVVAVFILLSANEIFGNPPLMTPAFHPPGGMQGDWHANVNSAHLRLTIRPDGSIGGAYDGVALSGARILRNRSWFGQLMRWRTDYYIHGALAEERFSAPVMQSGPYLVGSLFLRQRPYHLFLARVAAAAPPEAPSDFGAWWRDFQATLARRDVKAIAALAHYPLNWENGTIRQIKSAQDLIDNFDQYFTPEIRKIIASKTPQREPTGNYVITWKARGNEYSLYYKPEGAAFVMDGLSEGPP